jgi:Fe-S cluster assembly protein SufB
MRGKLCPVSEQDQILNEVTTSEYKYGFYTDVESDKVPPGLNEDVIRMISAKKNEPEWMTEWRLDAFKIWQGMDRARMGQCAL